MEDGMRGGEENMRMGNGKKKREEKKLCVTPGGRSSQDLED
jgi:hypothetical protein